MKNLAAGFAGIGIGCWIAITLTSISLAGSGEIDKATFLLLVSLNVIFLSVRLLEWSQK